MQHYILTPEARDDLIGIQDFIAKDNPVIAARVIDECFGFFKKLSEHPYIGHKRQDLTLRNVRFWKFYSYLIIYEPDMKPIAIIRVLSSYRDIASIL